MLQQRFLPPLVTKALDSPHTIIGASELKSPGQIATLLLFFDRVIIDCCPICLTPTQLHSLTLLTNKGLVIPKILFPFSLFPRSVVDFLSEHQDELISCYADDVYSQIALMGKGEELHRRLHEEIPELEKLIHNAPPLFKKQLRPLTEVIKLTPSTYAHEVVRTVRGSLQHHDGSAISKCLLQSDAVLSLEDQRIYKSTPTSKLDDFLPYQERISRLFPATGFAFRDAIEFTARGLHVAWSPDLPLKEYLDIIATYRGRLRKWVSQSPSPTSAMSSAIDTVRKLNAELDEISASRKYRWGRIPLQIAKTPRFISLLLTLATGHNAERIIAALPKVPASPYSPNRHAPRKPTLTETIMAKVFSKDIPVIQLWGLRTAITTMERPSP
jgi:hypothetical protein